MPSSSGSEERVREQRKIKLLIPRKEPTGGGGGATRKKMGRKGDRCREKEKRCAESRSNDADLRDGESRQRLNNHKCLFLSTIVSHSMR